MAWFAGAAPWFPRLRLLPLFELPCCCSSASTTRFYLARTQPRRLGLPWMNAPLGLSDVMVLLWCGGDVVVRWCCCCSYGSTTTSSNPPLSSRSSTSPSSSASSRVDIKSSEAVADALQERLEMLRKRQLPTFVGWCNPLSKMQDMCKTRMRHLQMLEGKWRCNLCMLLNDDKRSELSVGTVEFVAPTEYMVQPQMPPSYFFLLPLWPPSSLSLTACWPSCPSRPCLSCSA